MSKEYRAVEEVADPIMLARDVQGVTYDKMGEAKLASGERRRCGVLEIDSSDAMVQLHKASTGINLNSSKVRFLGHTTGLGVSENMLSRMFGGMGKLIDGGPDTLPKKCTGIDGLPMNPAVRSYPEEFIQTGVSAIDGLNTLVRGQRPPILSVSGLPRANLTAQVACQAKVRDTGESFAVASAAMDITLKKANFFIESFRETGTIDWNVMFIDLADGPAVERVVTPRMALTATEYLAFKKNMYIPVILTDTTNHADSLREISVARKKVPGRRDYPGYMYTDLASLYGRVGCQEDKNGSVTVIPILTMPEDDKARSIPDLISCITEGQIIPSRELCRKDVTPPIDVLPSLSRLKDKGTDGGRTRADHVDVMNQLFAAYVRSKGAKELIIILGEAALTNMDKLYAKFVDEFEKKYISQGCYVDHDIKRTMEIDWKLLRILPEDELKRIRNKFPDLYYRVK